MRKKLGVLLGISLVISLLLGFMLYKSEHDNKRLAEELCGTITLSSIGASSRLDEAIEADDRRLALMAGNELMKLSGLLNSSVCLEMGVQNVYGSGSLSSLAELIIWGDDALNVASIGRPDDDTPFSAQEIKIMEQMSTALKGFGLAFYSEETTLNTYMHEERSYSDIHAVNRALTSLQDAMEPIFAGIQ